MCKTSYVTVRHKSTPYVSNKMHYKENAYTRTSISTKKEENSLLVHIYTYLEINYVYSSLLQVNKGCKQDQNAPLT